MKRRNPVAKHGRRFNKGGPHQDKREKAREKARREEDRDASERTDGEARRPPHQEVR